ncbi:MAG: methyltransferase domain-containing protein [Actinomycetota bacterium]|nr:methyltransferase domain-containing protein [Actinomycetota bacterium]
MEQPGHQHGHHDHHQPGHQPGHQHGHQHERPADFDWEAMADSLELDGMMLLPIVHDIVRELAGGTDWSAVRHVIDVGSGPGVIATALAGHAQQATITALDSSAPLLERARARAAAAEMADRLRTVEADLDHGLPALDEADVIWASMVLHHVADPPAVLAALYQQLRSGGTLAIVEFAGPTAVLPPHDPLLATGAWGRLEAHIAQVIGERLGSDPLQMHWPQWLAQAGFTDITDRVAVAHHAAPLAPQGRQWVAKRVTRGLQMVSERITAHDAAVLAELADSAAARDDLFVRIERRVLTARRA